MDADNKTVSLGDILYKSKNNLSISTIYTPTSNVEVHSSNGFIIDVHNDLITNITADGINIIGMGAEGTGNNLDNSESVIKAKNIAIDISANKVFTSIPNKSITQVDYHKDNLKMGLFNYSDEIWNLQFINDIEYEKSISQIELNIESQNAVLYTISRWMPILTINTEWDSYQDSLHTVVTPIFEGNYSRSFMQTSIDNYNVSFDTLDSDFNNDILGVTTSQNAINNIFYEDDDEELFEYWIEELSIW